MDVASVPELPASEEGPGRHVLCEGTWRAGSMDEA